jgi:MFS family permease
MAPHLMVSAKIPAPYLASYLADRFGRRVALFVGSIFCIIGALVNTFATGVGMLIGGRVILGVGTGMQATIAAPMVQELCHPVSLPWLFIADGSDSVL